MPLRGSRRARVSRVVSAALLSCAALWRGAAGAQPAPEPLIAIGDLHADLAAAQRAFHIAGVTDAQGRWALKGGVVVQTGALTARGPDGEPLLRWIRDLEGQAAAAGSRFVVLLGNHEVMNLHGDWRYVSQGDIESFGGLEARRRALSLSARGEWARWLLTKEAVALVGDTALVHGGVSEEFAAPAPDLSRRVTEAVLTDPRAPILGDRGPLWYRGYWLRPEEEVCAEAARALALLGARRMVMGHTTQADGRVHARCGGALLAIDTGISRLYGGRAAALRVAGGAVFAIYEGGEVLISGEGGGAGGGAGGGDPLKAREPEARPEP